MRSTKSRFSHRLSTTFLDNKGERIGKMSSWVKCSIGQGMLPGEYAVEVVTLDVGNVSLFASEDKVRVDEA